ncbi:hypothetical protein ACYFX5_13435 [Bremerella sp. T1]|uniref:hypothetical protein n=1 Tax=Bremerella sp. TYQ1 TaxID=3119568 RepID=UPI001CCEA209|nr:hypothetical protein [Bremerella volcania]UBM34061.1 hypothetical protein LA756_15375 [Bremerella volcania]
MRMVLLAMGLLVPMALGCTASESNDNRLAVSGTVTLDGKPLETGRISFVSEQDVANGIPPASAEIQDGKYTIDSTPGEKVVKISSRVETGRDQVTDEPITKETIPAKYNKKSELTTTVTEGGENMANFEL